MITCTPLQPILVYVFVYTHIWTTHTNPLVNRSTDLSSTLKTRHVFVPYRPSPVSLRLDSFCWIHQWYYPITWICIYKAICIICVNWNEFINLRSRIGEPGCGSSSSWEELHDQETQRSLDSADKFNRITLDCQTTSGGGSRAQRFWDDYRSMCWSLLSYLGRSPLESGLSLSKDKRPWTQPLSMQYPIQVRSMILFFNNISLHFTTFLVF